MSIYINCRFNKNYTSLFLNKAFDNLDDNQIDINQSKRDLSNNINNNKTTLLYNYDFTLIINLLSILIKYSISTFGYSGNNQIKFEIIT